MWMTTTICIQKFQLLACPPYEKFSSFQPDMWSERLFVALFCFFYYFFLIRQCLTINIWPQICFSCAVPPNQERRRFVKNKSTERINKTTHHNGFPATFILLIFVTICQVIVAVIFVFCLFHWTPHWLDWHQKRTIEPRKNWPLFCSRNSFFF